MSGVPIKETAVEELLLALKALEFVSNATARLMAAAKETGDPLPQEVLDQMARSKVANDHLHANAE